MKFCSACLSLLLILSLNALVTHGQPNDNMNDRIKTYELLGTITTPEGISIDTRNGDIYTGSMQDGSMQVTRNGESKYFVTPGSGVLLPNVLGLKVDSTNERIWVCSNDFSQSFQGTPKARISVLNLADGAVIKQFSETDLMLSEGVYPFVNDVVLDKAGNAYFSNSASNAVFKIKADLSEVQLVASKFPSAPEGKKYSLNGIAITPDERYIVVNTFIMNEPDAAGLFRVNVENGDVMLIKFEERKTDDFSRSGGDGLLFIDGQTLLCMSIASTILKIDFDKDLTEAVITNISNGSAAQDVLKGSATMAAYEDKIYTTNAQGMALFVPSLKAELPFKIIQINKSVLGL